ncbi:hypothetical protein L1987_25496 [Smallanthus sonchifolius]|uniref:Uncharacterized protein n=1 Tax=Smallanthus sonchifolius TaxID=185202 RepID=A0ACB9INE8_9ASTR|nr:hypothetical protein L1987_25496 [Smallanthus sonchifolius]
MGCRLLLFTVVSFNEFVLFIVIPVCLFNSTYLLRLKLKKRGVFGGVNAVRGEKVAIAVAAGGTVAVVA